MRRPRRAPPRAAQQRERLPDRRARSRTARPNSAQNTRAHVSASGSARWPSSTSMPSAPASGGEPALALRAARSGARARPCTAPAGRASPGPARSNACAQHAPVERRASARPARGRAMRRASSRQDLLGRRRVVDHRLRDAGEALDAARQRPRHAAPATRSARAARRRRRARHRPRSARSRSPGSAVGLGVDGEELRGGEGQLGERHTEPVRPAPDGMQARVRASATPSRGRSSMHPSPRRIGGAR